MPADLRKIIISSLKKAVFLILVLFSITGIVWGILNFSYLQPFSETEDLIWLAKALKSSGRTGILYPAFLLVIMTLMLDSSSVFFIPVYVIQIVLSFTAWYVFALNVKKAVGIDSHDAAADSALQKRRERIGCILFSAIVVCNPFSMQCNLAVLEYSFAASFLCFLVSFYIRFSAEWKNDNLVRGTEKALIDISVLSLFWLLLCLTRREFILIGAVLPVLLAIRIAAYFIRTKKTNSLKYTLPHVVLFAVFAAIVLLTDSLFYSGEKLSVKDHLERSLFYRVAWDAYFSEADSVPDEITDMVSDQAIYQAQNDPGYIMGGFTDEAVLNAGTDEVTYQFFDYASHSFGDNKKGYVKDFIGDLFGYIFPNVKTELLLEGKGFPGYAPGNYEIMGRMSPKLTKYYLRMFSILSAAIFLITLFITLCDKEKRKNLRLALVPLLVIIISSVVYTLDGSNVWDHRKVLFTSCVITAFSAYEAVLSREGSRKNIK